MRFDDDGGIVEYYSDLDGDIIEISFDEVDPAEVEYDENGRITSFHCAENGFNTTVWFLYDQWGRLETVISNTMFA